MNSARQLGRRLPDGQVEAKGWRIFSRELPADLRDWLADSTLARWVEEELHEAIGTPAGVAEDKNIRAPGSTCHCGGQQDPGGESMVLARVLGFALASQIFGSEDVARACRVDAVVKGLCEERAPFAHEVMRFRRKNRPLLERLLTEIFTRAVVHHFGLDPVVLPPELKQDLRQHAKERLDLARLMDLE